jgi:hypothetical protein
VIRIRYEDFSAATHDMAGLYGRVEHGTRGVTVCLLPGLTAGQRQAAIRRLRQEASRGFGPALPLPQLAFALGVDQVRTTARVARSIVRLHPAVTLVPSAFVVAMVTLFVIAAGDRSGLAPGTGRGLADAAVSRSVARALGTPSGPARATRVTADQGTEVTVAGGPRPGSGRSAVTPPAHPSTATHQRHAQGRRSHRGYARSARYACSPMIATAARPRDGQLACRRPVPWALPRTAHRPGPLDLAW